MAIDELTDSEFFNAYQSNPQIKKLVDDIQRRYNVHRDQRGKPGYNEANIPIAMNEAKQVVSRIIKQQEEGHESKSKGHKEKRGLFGLPKLTPQKAAFGLAAIVLALAVASSFGAAAPAAAFGYKAASAYSATAYTAPMYAL